METQSLSQEEFFCSVGKQWNANETLQLGGSDWGKGWWMEALCVCVELEDPGGG